MSDQHSRAEPEPTDAVDPGPIADADIRSDVGSVGEARGKDVNQPFDDGMQPERTALAWRRTGLALVAGSLVATRILPEVFSVWAVVPAGVGIAVAVAILVAAQLRYRAVHIALVSSDSAEIPVHGGGLPALVAGFVIAGGIAALIAALVAVPD